jgi:hypothetical protein
MSMAIMAITCPTLEFGDLCGRLFGDLVLKITGLKPS